MSFARRDHRKSKFGFRHDIRLIYLYVMTKSEFWFSMIPPSNRDRRVRSWLDPVVVPSNPHGRVARTSCIICFSRKFTKSRALASHGGCDPVFYLSTLQYTLVCSKFSISFITVLYTWEIDRCRKQNKLLSIVWPFKIGFTGSCLIWQLNLVIWRKYSTESEYIHLYQPAAQMSGNSGFKHRHKCRS
jgi:hypothetical protein